MPPRPSDSKRYCSRCTYVCAASFVLAAAAAAAGLAAAGDQLGGTSASWDDHPAIQYSTRQVRDPLSALVRRVETGTVQLAHDGSSGFLRSLLQALKVPIESQVALFVKDSLQADLIERRNPRTMFFNDTAAVAWVRGGFIELASQDPEQGVVFYTLTETSEGQPHFERRTDCLFCHHSPDTAGVPGMLVRSLGHSNVDHRLPLEERWGGWYVTGRHGTIRHRGNVELTSVFAPVQSDAGLNWPSLEGKFDGAGYLASHSDIVALMLFEHQMHLMNLLTRFGWEARVGAYEQDRLSLRLEVASGRRPLLPLSQGAREIVDYLLFIDEAPLADAIQGSTAFAEMFSALGPRDRKGRSLRDLDLQRRLLRYPCSYIIYTAQFDALPGDARNAVYRRMWQVLSGEEHDARYGRLSRADREAIVEILIDTKKDLPKYFRPLTSRF